MTMLPIVLLLTGGVALGLYMGLNYLKGVRNKPLLIGAHVLLGLASLEPMAIALSRKAEIGPLAPGGLVLAFASGAMTPIIAKQSRTATSWALGTHAAIAACAYVYILILMSRFWT